ncbi:hypothetical protein SAMN02745131_01346 [Flavisolibacter ginsengisoli DSM 18119]|jgi:hypothetical protein|uniref:Uncharacterized protein n=1 Tax=Flavisolibacter ginsengisoli DSM 18119 TaxID=1121884 RepID=A0A1M4X5S9_9BACT|nr:hypothetical protein SAMN02745131_01346 [Flavisolibacter ginsengisoli DSM 18119]
MIYVNAVQPCAAFFSAFLKEQVFRGEEGEASGTLGMIRLR